MVEHVRRRALMSNAIDQIFVATCDTEIANVIRGYGGDVIIKLTEPSFNSCILEEVL